MPLGFAKAHHQIPLEEKVGVALGYGSYQKFGGSSSILTQWLKLATSNLVYSLGLPRPTIKPHPEKKWVWPCVREAPIYFWFPFNISATAELFS